MAGMLNIEAFNRILCDAGVPREELLVMELQTAYSLKIQKMEELVAAINTNGCIRNIMDTINNIDSNLDKIGNELEEIRRKSKKENKNESR